jgi:HD-like signal output (HDOD) protein
MSDINNWIKRIGDQPIPVLSGTIEEVRRLCQTENVSIPKLTEVVERDPGLTVQILRNANQRKRSSLSSEVTSVNQALMMMGTEQLSRFPENLPSLDETLSEESQQRLLLVFARAYHAGRQALDWAIQRRDMTPDEVFAAAELHFLAEMLFAMVAPEKLQEIDELRRDKHIASGEAEYLVLGFTFNQFTRALARKWQLPSLVIEALHDSNAQYPRAYGIMLAVQTAHSAFIDWHSEKTLELYEQVAEWLGFDQASIITDAHKLAVAIADDSQIYAVRPAAALLPLLPAVVAAEGEQQVSNRQEPPASDEHADICLSPQPDVLKTALQELSQMGPGNKALDIVAKTVRGMHDGVGLNRVVFARHEPMTNSLKGIAIAGTSNDPVFNRFEIKLDLPNLFSRLMEKPQAVVINDSNRQKFWPLVPGEFAKFIGTNSFVAMSIFGKNQALGMFYADRHTDSCQIDELSYKYFKTMSTQCAKVLNTLNKIVLE